jgi:putative secretion ATPase (PEP-CTERM system associated)
MYQTYYKLTSKPFQLSPDFRYFYGSRNHKKALAYLLYGVEQHEGFIVITGNVGAGKSTLVQGLLDRISGQNIVTASLATTQLEKDDLLRMVASSFGLEYEGISKARLINNIEEFLKKSAWADKRVLLIIDEAQNLPVQSLEELRMLSNFQEHGIALLQTFLLGQKNFIEILQREDFEQLRQRVIASFNLEALNSDEVQGYIEHRLSIAGWQGDPEFQPPAYKAIYNFTKGIPRRINTLCERMMVYGCLEEIHQFDGGTVQTVVEELYSEIIDRRLDSPTKPEPAVAVSESSDKARIDELEKKVKFLEGALQFERARLKKVLTTRKTGPTF